MELPAKLPVSQYGGVMVGMWKSIKEREPERDAGSGTRP